MKTASFHIALIQARLAWENVEANLSYFDERLAGISGTDLIVLPEMFASGFTMRGKERIAEQYETIRAWMLDQASRKNALIAGSTIFSKEGKYYNRLIAAFPEGKTGIYDKRHCFRMGEEHLHFTPGQTHTLLEYKGVRIAPFICYDLRFPVWSRNTSDYDLALYVADWPAARREAWQLLLKARAVENQAYVAGVNCVGEDGNGLLYAGDSMVVSPKGEVFAEATPCREEVIQATLDMEALRIFREKFPVLADRDRFNLLAEE